MLFLCFTCPSKLIVNSGKSFRHARTAQETDKKPSGLTILFDTLAVEKSFRHAREAFAKEVY